MRRRGRKSAVDAVARTNATAPNNGDLTLKLIIRMLQVAGLAAALLLTQVGCVESGQEPVTDNPAVASPVPEGAVRGTVLETMNSGGYTYVLIETDRDTLWVAGRRIAVRVGDTLQASQGMPMREFESKSLNRTFDVVHFAGVMENLSAPALPKGQPGGVLPAGHPSTDGTVEEKAADTKVRELKPGENIAYVYANKDALAGQQISLRGTVVKYNQGILGRNFIHIQDGSGDVADGSNDLTVTSEATTAVGEIVVLTGRIILNKDFGAGYSFPVMMEDAGITTEYP